MLVTSNMGYLTFEIHTTGWLFLGLTTHVAQPVWMVDGYEL